MRMRVVVAAAVLIAMALVMWATAATAKTAGAMTLGEFRAHPESGQTYMVLGAIAVTDRLGVLCPQGIVVAEWRAALVHRSELDEKQPWVEVLGALMDARGCKVEQVKADT